MKAVENGCSSRKCCIYTGLKPGCHRETRHAGYMTKGALAAHPARAYINARERVGSGVAKRGRL